MSTKKKQVYFLYFSPSINVCKKEKVIQKNNCEEKKFCKKCVIKNPRGGKRLFITLVPT